MASASEQSVGTLPQALSVMRGLDPRIHLLRKRSLGEGDGLPGQAR
jgi:hypothetical protein